MRKKDLTLLAVIIIISAVLSFFVSGWIIGSPDTDPMEAEIVESISSEFSTPDSRFFSDDSINPTQLIRVGDEEGNVSPFGQSN